MAVISIIIPVFNSEFFLEKCLKSVLNQTYTKIEVILINDGSTDNSLEICEKFQKNDNRVILLNQNNQGVAMARNSGLEIATGDYIGFVDSDDYVTSEMYEKLLVAITKEDCDIAECGYFRLSTDNLITNTVQLKNEITIGSYNCCYDYLNGINTTNFNVNKLYRASILHGIKYQNFKYSEDFVFNSQVFYRCSKKITIDDCCYFYVNNLDSLTNMEFNKNKLDMIYAGNYIYTFFEEKYPELCKYVSLYTLNHIRKIYEELMRCILPDKKIFQNILIEEYNRNYIFIKSELFKIVKYKKTIVALWLFKMNPDIYCIIENYRTKKTITSNE